MGTGQAFHRWRNATIAGASACGLLIFLCLLTMGEEPVLDFGGVDSQGLSSLFGDAAGRTVSFQSSQMPTKYVSEMGENVVLDEPAGRLADQLGSPAAARLAATFRVISNAGATDRGVTVLESCFRPGRYIVAEWNAKQKTYLLRMQARPAQRSKRAKFSFMERGPTALRWTDGKRGLVQLYARHFYGMVQLASKQEGEKFLSDTTWIAQPGLTNCTRADRRAAGQEADDLSHYRVPESASQPWNMMMDLTEDRHAVTKKVFLDVAIGNDAPRRIVIGLFGNTVPKTAYNFYMLCTGDKGTAKNGASLHYKGTTFHRVIPGFMAQGGDISRGHGGPGESVFGGAFVDENFELKHLNAGTVSMANFGRDTNMAQFFITFKSTRHLDGKHVVFGTIVDGKDALLAMEQTGSRRGSTTVPITITNSGAL